MITSLRDELTDAGLTLYQKVRRVPRPQQDDLFFHLTRLLKLASQAIQCVERDRHRAVRRRRPRLCLN